MEIKFNYVNFLFDYDNQDLFDKLVPLNFDIYEYY